MQAWVAVIIKMIFNMSNLDKLIQHFEKFPGIGGRQAKRFAFHLLTLDPSSVSEISELIATLQTSVVECASCHRFFSKNGGMGTLCSICEAQNRDHSKLLVVAQDSDIQAIERSGVYDGLYFVLGGTVPLLHSEDAKKLRGGTLKATVEARLKPGLTEIILGFAVNPDGENTTRFVESIISPLFINLPQAPKLSQLGRGLSTGSELEYADPETIKNALRNRSWLFQYLMHYSWEKQRRWICTWMKNCCFEYYGECGTNSITKAGNQLLPCVSTFQTKNYVWFKTPNRATGLVSNVKHWNGSQINASRWTDWSAPAGADQNFPREVF